MLFGVHDKRVLAERAGFDHSTRLRYFLTMKILHVGKYYSPYLGGMETALQNAAEGLLDAGCDVTLVTAGHCDVDSREVICGPKTGRQGTLLRAAVRAVFNSQPLAPGLVGILRREVALFQPDLVQLHLPNPLAIATWMGLAATGMPHRPPMTVWYHADITRQKLGRRLVQPLITGCLDRAAGVCVSSQAMAQGSPILQPYRDKIGVVPYGIKSLPWIDVTATTDGPFLFVGRLVPYKGLTVLFEALARVPAARLVVVGDGPQKPTLLALGKRLGILDRVDFAGLLSDAGVAAHLATARALVLPSVDASEAFGLVQLEAMAAGVPVITTDLPTGVPEVGLAGKTGFLVLPGDSQGLAEALGKLQANPVLAREMGAAGRERFTANFARSRMIDRLIAWYEQVLNRTQVQKGKA